MKTQHFFRLGVMLAWVGFLAGTTGCSSFDLSKRIPWGDSDGTPPMRIMAVWTDTIMNSPDKPAMRGFGGRVMFYAQGEDPIKTSGTMIVYAFDETNREPTNVTPDRKYVFRSEEFAKHYSKGRLGHSYSFWLPWDEVGGLQKEISLIVRFMPDKGGVIVAEQTKHLLPGVTAELAKIQQQAKQNQLARMAAGNQSSPAMQNWPGQPALMGQAGVMGQPGAMGQPGQLPQSGTPGMAAPPGHDPAMLQPAYYAPGTNNPASNYATPANYLSPAGNYFGPPNPQPQPVQNLPGTPAANMKKSQTMTIPLRGQHSSLVHVPQQLTQNTVGQSTAGNAAGYGVNPGNAIATYNQTISQANPMQGTVQGYPVQNSTAFQAGGTAATNVIYGGSGTAMQNSWQELGGQQALTPMQQRMLQAQMAQQTGGAAFQQQYTPQVPMNGPMTPQPTLSKFPAGGIPQNGQTANGQGEQEPPPAGSGHFGLWKRRVPGGTISRLSPAGAGLSQRP